MRKIFFHLLVVFLTIQNIAECKRSSSSGSRSSSSSSKSHSSGWSSHTNSHHTSSYSHANSKPAISRTATSRPAISNTATSRPAISNTATSRPATSSPAISNSATNRPATSRPATSRPDTNVNNNNVNSHTDNVKLSYSENTHSQSNKPSAPEPPPYTSVNKNQAPPPYSSVNNPSSISTNQFPPSYSPNAPDGHSTLQSSDYPRQPYVNNHLPTSHGQSLHQSGSVAAGGTIYSGPPGIPHGQPTYYQPELHPVPVAPPTYYAPGAQPPGAVLYPVVQAPHKSDSDFETGYILGRLSRPSYRHHHVHTSSHVSREPVSATADNDKIIIVNNGPPGSVTTTNADGTLIINNRDVPAASPPMAQMPHEPPTPLAPFQPGSTQEVQYPQVNRVEEPIVAPLSSADIGVEKSFTNSVVGISNGTDAQLLEPPPGGTVCYPIMGNQTDPSDPSKVIEFIKEIACYEVPANPQPPSNQQQQTVSVQPQLEMRPEFYNQPSSSAIENINQKTSPATIVESAQIKQSGAINNQSVSIWIPIIFAIFASVVNL